MRNILELLWKISLQIVEIAAGNPLPVSEKHEEFADKIQSDMFI